LLFIKAYIVKGKPTKRLKINKKKKKTPNYISPLTLNEIYGNFSDQPLYTGYGGGI